MKRITVFFVVLALVFALMMPAFATASERVVYTDEEAGVSFTLPTGWEQKVNDDSEMLQAAFVRKGDENVEIQYARVDLFEQLSVSGRAGLEREDFDMNIMTKEDFAGGYGLPEENIESKTFNGKEYYKIKADAEHFGYDAPVSIVQYYHFENGWAYFFQTVEYTDDEYRAEVEELLESVEYSGGKGATTTEVPNSAAPLTTSPEESAPAEMSTAAVIVISLLITLIAYGAFPILFALLRKKPIEDGKYRKFCYIVNGVIAVAFFVLRRRGNVNDVTNFAPYLIWTFVFTALGVKILKKKDVKDIASPDNTGM